MCPSDATPPSESNHDQADSQSSSRHSLFGPLFVIATILTGITACSRHDGAAEPELLLHTIDRGDFSVRAHFSSILASANTTEFVCEVSAARHIDGRMSNGAELLWIIPNGEVVEKGDLLVEFDAGLVKELRDDWQLKVVKSVGLLKQASLRVENEQSKRDTDLANATTQLEVMLSAKDTLDDIQKLEISQLLAYIKEARKGVMIAGANRKYVKTMDRLGLPGAGQETPEQAQLRYLLETKGLGNFLGEFEKLSRYDHPNKSEEMKAAADQARRLMVQSQQNYDAVIQQLLAEKNGIQKSLDTEKERLSYYEAQLANCTVRAPYGGVVEHILDEQGEDSILAGTILRERQKILNLHDLTQLQLQATVDSPIALQLRTGMAASIYFTPDSGTSSLGSVTQVRQLSNSAEVIITPDELPRLRPGTTADVKMLLAEREDVIRIPVAALIALNDQPHCYVSTQYGREQRPLQLGAIGYEFAEVLHGLDVGESVISDATMVDLTPADGK